MAISITIYFDEYFYLFNRLKLTQHNKCENGIQFTCEATSEGIQNRLIRDSIPENALIFIVSGIIYTYIALFFRICVTLNFKGLPYDTKVLEGLCKVLIGHSLYRYI